MSTTARIEQFASPDRTLSEVAALAATSKGYVNRVVQRLRLPYRKAPPGPRPRPAAPSPTQRRLAVRVDRWRRERGLGIKEAGAALGVGQGVGMAILRAEFTGSVEVLERVAAVMGVQPWELIAPAGLVVG